MSKKGRSIRQIKHLPQSPFTGQFCYITTFDIAFYLSSLSTVSTIYIELQAVPGEAGGWNYKENQHRRDTKTTTAETEFLAEIGTKVIIVFLLAIHSQKNLLLLASPFLLLLSLLLLPSLVGLLTITPCCLHHP
jgi:hypothetical protein